MSLNVTGKQTNEAATDNAWDVPGYQKGIISTQDLRHSPAVCQEGSGVILFNSTNIYYASFANSNVRRTPNCIYILGI